MSESSMASHLVLASTSPFRKTLLERLQVNFDTFSPNVDETPLQGETAIALVKRLAELKARAAKDSYDNALVIGSDQVCMVEGDIVGKPATHDHAVAQLMRVSGKSIAFHTGLCLFNTHTDRVQVEVVTFTAHFRDLTTQQIENYLQKDRPYNCSGSFKSETLGIALLDKMSGDDPNALIGLPLIRLVRMLENEQFFVI